MRRVLALLAVMALAGLVDGGGVPLPLAQQDALTTIDEVPTVNQLTKAFGSGSASAAANELVSIAGDASTDVGIRLRAIRALASYCPPPSGQTTGCDDLSAPHATLVQIINDNSMASSGPDVLTLRAAIESLGQLQVAGDLAQLQSFLNHQSRDVRATTALALRDLCNGQAVQPLRTRLQLEASAQVQLAIAAALRVLGQPPCI